MIKLAFYAFCLTLGTTAAIAADPQEVDAYAAEARAAGTQLFIELKKVVTEAAQAKGAAAAIEVCNVKALPTSQRVSEETGMDVGRTSHKLRNPKNAPDAWEKKVLADFQARKAAGEPLEEMEYYEVVDDNGKEVFRYMKAIPLGGVCFNCHGTSLKPEVKARLDELYPEDKARGFIPGDLRGALTIKKDL
ncbi:MAG: DUF3365 domain-containing protein [Gammaproteobacteria bacterium]|jgi:hypothetical protein|nr:DUF3365 domain-containing protein [Gammaproteobacteria bacterium]